MSRWFNDIDLGGPEKDDDGADYAARDEMRRRRLRQRIAHPHPSDPEYVPDSDPDADETEQA